MRKRVIVRFAKLTAPVLLTVCRGLPAYADEPEVPAMLVQACVEPEKDLSGLLELGRGRVGRERGVRLSVHDFSDSVSVAVGTRTDLRCMPVIESVALAIVASAR